MGVGGGLAVLESRGLKADMVLKAEKGVEVAEVDTGEEREELGEELGHEEVKLPAGCLEKIGRNAKEEAAGVFGKGVAAGGVEKGDSMGPGVGGGCGTGCSGVEGVERGEFPPVVGDTGVDLGEVGGS
jgi:hypothetical protein